MSRSHRPMAKGSTKYGSGGHSDRMLQISIYFDRETFGEINLIAFREARTFSYVVRELVEWGLEDKLKQRLQRRLGT